MSYQGNPKPHGVRAFGPRDSPGLEDHQGPLLLEQRRGDAWVEVGRYETADQAARALDELTGEGVHAGQLRLSPVAPTKRRRRWMFWAR